MLQEISGKDIGVVSKNGCIDDWIENMIQQSIFEKEDLNLCTKDRKFEDTQKRMFNCVSEKVNNNSINHDKFLY